MKALCALVLVVAIAAPAFAQQPAAPPGAHEPRAPAPGAGGGMMDMCSQMMGGQSDPKMLGRMLQMRGEIMKAVAEVLIKHGKAIESEAVKK